MTRLPALARKLLLAAVFVLVLAGTASGTSSSAKLSARLTKTSFTSAQASSVKLVCKFTAASKSFGYAITIKSGKKWKTVKKVSSSGNFKGSYTKTVKQLFAGKSVKLGSYKLKLTVDSGTKTLRFTVIKAKEKTPVTPPPSGSAPANTALPTISGTVKDGQTLAAHAGTWSGSPTPGYSYQWRRCDSSGASCSDISGATTSSYVLVGSDDHSTIRVQVTASNSYGSASATSAQTSAVVSVVLSADSGDDHSCAVLSDGTVKCWGGNENGQLGDGTHTYSATPVQVVTSPGHPLENVVQVSAGENFSCAVLSDHSVSCWGESDYGELGNNAIGSDVLTPAQVVGIGGSGTLSGVSQVSAGGRFACALLTDGTIDCWGDGFNGQIGNGSSGGSNDPAYPVHVYEAGTSGALFANVTSLSAGNSHACAVSAGSVYCWGEDDNGDLGTGHTGSESDNPALVARISATEVSAGYYDTCALLSAGTVDCWGLNYSGELGQGGTLPGTDSSTPVPVYSSGTTPLGGVSSIGVGGFHVCARLSSGITDCWGNNGDGELGNGTSADAANPVAVYSSGTTPLTNVSQLSPGMYFTCVVLAGGTMDCWGDNTSDQLGTGMLGRSTTPISVSGVADASGLSSGSEHACAIRSGGTVWCWGRNNSGQLGNGSTTDSSTPVQVKGAGGTGFLTNVAQVSAGAQHTCALVSTGSGTVWCWGDDEYGQLGDGTYGDTYGVRTTPVQVEGILGSGFLTGVAQISSGGYHTCARISGAVDCWGNDFEGELGDGATLPGSDSSTPVSTGLSSVTDIGAGNSHTCAVLASGAVDCWGWNHYGQLGRGTTTDSSSPAPVDTGSSTPLAGAVSVSAGSVPHLRRSHRRHGRLLGLQHFWRARARRRDRPPVRGLRLFDRHDAANGRPRCECRRL